MTKEEQDKIREELNRAFEKSEKEKADKKEEPEQKAEASVTETKEDTAASAVTNTAAEAPESVHVDRGSRSGKRGRKAEKSAPAKKEDKKKTPKAEKPASAKKKEKKPEQKSETSVPEAKEEAAASAVTDTAAEAPESVRVDRVSRSGKRGRKAEKPAPAKKEQKEKPKAVKSAPAKKKEKKPEKKTEASVPETKEKTDASAVTNTAEEATESVRGGRASRAGKKGRKHEKTEPKKKEPKKKEKKPAGKTAPAEKTAAEIPAASREEKSTRVGRAESRAKETGEKHGSAEPEKRGCLKWILIMLALMIVVFAASFGFFRYRSMLHSYTTAYIASTSKDAPVYTIEKEEKADGKNAEPGKAVEAERLVRGTQVKRYSDRIEIDDITYYRVDKTLPGASITEGTDIIEESGDDEDALYVREENLVSSPDDIVLEKEVYVRTPATIYSEESGPAIESFAPKGSRLEVIGFDKIRPDGSINKYQVKYTNDGGDSVKGYVYGKYMVDTQEKADAVYNGNGIADEVADDNYGYDLYGGRASNLDYYPFERPDIKGNEFCDYARAMYINCEAAVNYKPWVDLIKESGCNAVVIDIKDGVLAYESDVAKELSPTSYDTAYVSKDEYRKGIEAYKETDVYLIGRIVVFNDPIYAKDHPEDCIEYGGSTTWPSAYSRNVWEFNVRLAQEAIREFGFDEIQFDYVRFPENSFEMSKSGNADFRNVYGEEKGQAVQNFCMYAADQIHDAGAYFSVDVFGESAYGYMTAYGQYWAGISNVVDAISAMPYTDHMGVDGGWEDPYGIMNSWGVRAQKQQDKLEEPAVARTWITGYDTPHWDPTFIYGTAELKAQIVGIEDAGLNGGFIPWNAVSSIEKYTQYMDIWNAEE